MTQSIIITKNFIDKIISHCRKAVPDEACGILAGKSNEILRVYEMTNVEKSPESYLMDSKEQFRVMKEIRQDNLDFVGIYHSHPSSPAYPSRKDKNLAVYEEAVYMIIGLAKGEAAMRVFSIKKKKVAEVDIFVKK